MNKPLSSLRLAATGLLLALLTSACSYMPQLSPALAERLSLKKSPPPAQEAMAAIQDRQDMLFAVTQDGQLISFNASTPGVLFSKTPITGLMAGEQMVGIDFRVARGELFGLSSKGRLLKIHLGTGAVTPVGKGLAFPGGQSFGFDFNPTVDRLRLVSDTGANLRLHPDTGAMVDYDATAPGVQPDQPLAFGPGDLLAGSAPRVVAAAYTYNRSNDKLTTMYAIDAALGYLVIQGSAETAPVVVSPNTGQLQTVGPLNIDPFDHAAFDIGDLNNAAYLVTTREGARESRLYEVNLGSGQARLIGAIASDRPVVGLAIEP